MILPATEKDIPQMVTIHKEALPDTIFGRMTDAQLARFYEEKIRLKNSILLVQKKELKMIRGFIASYQNIIINNWKFIFIFIFNLRNWISLILSLRILFWMFFKRSYLRGRVEICVLAVLPDYQGKGIGTELVRTFIDQCKKNLFVITDNDLSLRFYEKMNFTRVYQCSFLNNKRYLLINF